MQMTFNTEIVQGWLSLLHAAAIRINLGFEGQSDVDSRSFHVGDTRATKIYL